MLLFPRRFKYKKIRKGSLPTNVVSSCRNPEFGTFGLKAEWFGILTAKRLEASFRVISKLIKKTGRLWVRVFPQIAVSKKPVEVRMGKGKGPVDHWVAKVRPGTMLFELTGLSSRKAEEVFKRASTRLPFKTRMVSN